MILKQEATVSGAVLNEKLFELGKVER